MPGGSRYTVYNIFCARDPTIRQPLLLCIFLMLNQQLSGVNAVIFFTVSIFQSSRIALDANEATIMVGGVLLIATIASSYSVSYVNRRTMLIGTQGCSKLVEHKRSFLHSRNSRITTWKTQYYTIITWAAWGHVTLGPCSGKYMALWL